MGNGTPSRGLAPAPADPGNFAQYRTQMRENPEDLWQPIYDRANYAAAGQFEVTFFTIPLGGNATLIRAGVAAAVAKSRRDTNLEQAGVMPSKAFKWVGLSLTFIPLQQAVAVAGTQSIPDDIQRLMYGGFLEIRLIDKPYLYLPLHKIPATGIYRGTVGGAYTAGNAVASGGGGGTGSPRDIYWLNTPLTLDPYENFSARMQFDGSPALIQTFDMQLFFEGTVRRPGQ